MIWFLYIIYLEDWFGYVNYAEKLACLCFKDRKLLIWYGYDTYTENLFWFGYVFYNKTWYNLADCVVYSIKNILLDYNFYDIIQIVRINAGFVVNLLLRIEKIMNSVIIIIIMIAAATNCTLIVVYEILTISFL